METARVPGPLALLRELLARHPVARVSALSPDGNPSVVPADLVLGPDQVSIASPGLAGYAPEDRPAILAAFDRALALGVAHTSARMLHAPDTSWSLHLVDTSEAYGVVIAISIIQDSQAAVERLTDLPVVPPRVARVKKSSTAVILDIDEATSSILGWTRDEVIGRRSLEFIHPDDQQLAIENWLHLMTNPSLQPRARIRHQARDGSWIWFETSQRAALDSEEPCVLTEMVDISNEMAAQQALEAREQLLHQLTQTLPLGVFQIDAEQRIVHTNDRLFDVVGLPRAETLMAQLALVVPAHQDALEEALDAVLNGALERTLDVQLSIMDAAGPRMCQISLRPLMNNAAEIFGAVGCVADVTEAMTLRRELERRATFDGLTDCHNRAATMAELESVLADAGASHSGTAVVFIDLDLFKTVNDRFGHAAGNELLVHTAQQLRAAVGERSTVGRIGGDEFLVISPNVVSRADARRLADRIAASLRQSVSLSGGTVTCTASVGVAWSNDPLVDPERLVADADFAMYESKRQRTGHAVCAATREIHPPTVIPPRQPDNAARPAASVEEAVGVVE